MLSGEKCPTICGTLSAFEALLIKLKRIQREQDIEFYNILKDGIEKLEECKQDTDNVSAYTLAICEYVLFLIFCFLKSSLVLDPERKLQWFRARRPGSVDLARTTLLRAVCFTIFLSNIYLYLCTLA